jgi:hypothetical protein
MYDHRFASDNNYDTAVQELTPEHPRAEQPAGAKIELKAHQLSRLARCQEFESGPVRISTLNHDVATGAADTDVMETACGVIGDPVGAGKSYVVQSLLLGKRPTRTIARRA